MLGSGLSLERLRVCLWSERTELFTGAQRLTHGLGARAQLAEKRNHRLFIPHSSQTIVSDGGEGTG